jgi:hypothetical protein
MPQIYIFVKKWNTKIVQNLGVLDGLSLPLRECSHNIEVARVDCINDHRMSVCFFHTILNVTICDVTIDLN